jgi:hydrogenase maturation protease
MQLLIGYGSQLHSDDAVGQCVALALQKELPDLEILAAAQLLPEWAERISVAELVVFVDASSELSAGEIAFFNLDTSDANCPVGEATSTAISHYCTPQSLLELAEILYGKRPRAWLFLIGAADLSLGEGFSSAMSKSLPHLLESIRLKLSASST